MKYLGILILIFGLSLLLIPAIGIIVGILKKLL
jgi:hypothetical protein